MGHGFIVGTGDVSRGVAAGVAGPAVVVALGAGVATCNGLSSAQLAANYAVSGGIYEYGYGYLTPVLGFTAGWPRQASWRAAGWRSLSRHGSGVRGWPRRRGPPVALPRAAAPGDLCVARCAAFGDTGIISHRRTSLPRRSLPDTPGRARGRAPSCPIPARRERHSRPRNCPGIRADSSRQPG